ncbi:MAG: hypothetical protein Q9N68_05415 [Gammaproteobacteria bacterium]|nr:hypothetical protein [Gammaproteobacteria bacterium]
MQTFITLTFSLFLLIPISYAGQLDKFEESVSGSEPQLHQGHTTHPADRGHDGGLCHGDHWNFGCLFIDIFADIAFQMALYGGASSFYRIDPNSYERPFEDVESTELAPRFTGEALIPFLRLDISHQASTARVGSDDYRLEAGYGALALVYGQSHYQERQPTDALKLTRIYALYRMSFGEYVEVDWGMGSLTLEGNQTHDYFYVTSPILIHPSRIFGFEFRPSWAENLTEYDVSLLLKAKHLGAKLGYRTLSSNGEKLEGPYIGLMLNY